MNTKNRKSASRKNANRHSLRGKKGPVGAPAKPVKFSKAPFTTAQLFAANSKGKYKQCQLSLRNKVDVMVIAGTLIALKTRKQKGGAVGRPKDVYVLAEHFDASKHERLDVPVKKARKVRTVTAVVATVSPTTAPVVNEPAPVVNELVTSAATPPAPVISVPVEIITSTAPVSMSPVIVG